MREKVRECARSLTDERGRESVTIAKYSITFVVGTRLVPVSRIVPKPANSVERGVAHQLRS